MTSRCCSFEPKWTCCLCALRDACLPHRSVKHPIFYFCYLNLVPSWICILHPSLPPLSLSAWMSHVSPERLSPQFSLRLSSAYERRMHPSVFVSWKEQKLPRPRFCEMWKQVWLLCRSANPLRGTPEGLQLWGESFNWNMQWICSGP